MTPFVDIKPGRWALAFHEPFFFPGVDMAEWLEKFVSRGGGWDHIPRDEIFHLHHVATVMPKTYVADELLGHPRASLSKRLGRALVIAAGDKDEMMELRKRLFAIGDEADDAIEFVIERLARPVRRRVYAKALREIHATLPHIFGGVE